jgi:hypothetical protein
MTQTLYVHMNKILKKESNFPFSAFFGLSLPKLSAHGAQQSSLNLFSF